MNISRQSLLLAVGLAALGTAVTGFCFVANHRQAFAASPRLAEAEFAALRARFAGQPALLDMSRRQATDAPAISKAGAALHSFHTVIFDRRGGDRIVRIAVPYWLARRFVSGDGQFEWLGQLTFLDDTEFDPEPIQLSREQLERRGPGLVADYQHPGGGQFISCVD